MSITSSPLVTPPEYGRVGVVGLRSAGKTGIFVAIAAPREATPDSRTASLVALESNPHPDLVSGRQWIEKCLRALQTGALPEANDIEVPRLVLRCQFTEGTSLHFIEGMDYSGELLDPRVSTEVMAARLREYLGEVSGLIVLLEAPALHQPPAALTDAQDHLAQALALIAQEKKRRLTPMVLAVAKWDRQWPTQSDSSFDIHFQPTEASEDARLAAFLQQQPPPPHVTLLNALTAASGGHAACMAVSALGPCERTVDPATGGTVERPLQPKPLRSFGLARPFTFIAQRSDQLDLAWLRDRVTWRELFASFPRTDAARCVADRAIARMPEASPEHVEVLGLRRRIRHVRQAQNSALVAVLVFLVLFVEASFDHIGHNRAIATLTDPTIRTEEQRLPGENWLATYRDAPPWRHLLYGALGCLREQTKDLRKDVVGLTRAQARSELDSAIQAREDRAWTAALAIQDRESQNAALAEFLRLYATSERKDVANQMIRENVRQMAIAQCKTHLQHFGTELKQVHAASEASAREGTVDAFEAYQARLRGLLQQSKEQVADQLATLADDALSTQHAAFLQSHSTVQKLVSTLESQARIRRGFMQQWESDRLATALHMIAHPRGEAIGPEYDDLRDRFATHWQEKATDHLRRVCQGGSGWRKAMEQKEALLTELPQLASLTRKTESQLQPIFQAMHDRIHRDGMKYEYELLGRRPQNLVALTTFMKEFADCPHLPAIKELDRWFQLCAQPQQLRYTVKYIEFRGIGARIFYPQVSISGHGTTWLKNLGLGSWDPSYTWSRQFSLQRADLTDIPSFEQTVVPNESPSFSVSLAGYGQAAAEDAPCSWSRSREEKEHPEEAPPEFIDGEEVIGSKIVALTNGTKFYLVVEIFLDGRWMPLAKPSLPTWNE